MTEGSSNEMRVTSKKRVATHAQVGNERGVLRSPEPSLAQVQHLSREGPGIQESSASVATESINNNELKHLA